MALLLGDVFGVVSQSGPVEELRALGADAVPPTLEMAAAPKVAAAKVVEVESEMPAQAMAEVERVVEVDKEVVQGSEVLAEAEVEKQLFMADPEDGAPSPLEVEPVAQPAEAAAAPPPAASPSEMAVAEAAVEQADMAEDVMTSEEGGLRLPLWQLEAGLGGLLLALALATLWTWRRGMGRGRWSR